MIVPKDMGWSCPWVVVPKDTGLIALECESQKVITYVQVFGASMSDISIGTDMTVIMQGKV